MTPRTTPVAGEEAEEDNMSRDRERFTFAFWERGERGGADVLLGAQAGSVRSSNYLAYQ